MDYETSLRLKALSQRLGQLENTLAVETGQNIRRDVYPGAGFSLNLENPQTEIAFAVGTITAASGSVLGKGLINESMIDVGGNLFSVQAGLPVWNPWPVPILDGTELIVVKDPNTDTWMVLSVLSPPQNFVLLRITGKTTKPVTNTEPAGQHTFYSWELVDDLPTGEVYKDLSLATGGTSINNFPAYETSGYSMVPVDGSAIVHAWKGAGNYYFFVWPEENVLGLIVQRIESPIAAYHWVEYTPGGFTGRSGFTQVLNGRGTDVTGNVNLAWEENGQIDVRLGSFARLRKGFSPGAADVVVEAMPLAAGHQIDGFYFINTINNGTATGSSFTLTIYDTTGSQSATTAHIAYESGASALNIQNAINNAITAAGISPPFTVTITAPGPPDGIPGSALNPWLVLYSDTNSHPLLTANPCGLIGRQEWLFAKPSIEQNCTNIFYDVQDKDKCDYPNLNRYTRTLVYACGDLQSPIPQWSFVGQVGCCACQGTGSGSVGCCCPPNSLCVYWPDAIYQQLRTGVTLTPIFVEASCQWQWTGVIAGHNITITATWFGCDDPGGIGTIKIDVLCDGFALWGTFFGPVIQNASGCWDMTQTVRILNSGTQSQCPALGAVPEFGYVTEGPCVPSGSGSGCVPPITLCAYVSTATGGCACAIGSEGTLAFQGNSTYAGTLVLNCPNSPSLFVDVIYQNDGNTWLLEMEVTGCNGDSGLHTFSGTSFGNCLAGLPQCIPIIGPNECCGTGITPPSGSGLIIVPFEPPPVQPAVGDGFMLCVTAGPCGASGSGIVRYWCVLVNPASGSGGTVLTACCPGGLSTILTATFTGAGICNGAYTLVWNGITWEYMGGFGNCSFPPGVLVFQCQGTSFTLTGPGTLGGTYGQGSYTCAPLSCVFTGVDCTLCGGTGSATVTISSTGGGSGGSGSGGSFYECLPESDLSGSIQVGGPVTGLFGSGTIVSGPYTTPICDNNCPPTSGSGTGSIPPEPCCGYGTSQPPPLLIITFTGGVLTPIGSVPLIPVPGSTVEWQSNGTVRAGQCGDALITLFCNNGTWTLTIIIYNRAHTVVYDNCSASTTDAQCDPLVINFQGTCVPVDSGSTCGGAFTAVITT